MFKAGNLHSHSTSLGSARHVANPDRLSSTCIINRRSATPPASVFSSPRCGELSAPQPPLSQAKHKKCARQRRSTLAHAQQRSRGQSSEIARPRAGKPADVLICLAAAGLSTGTFLDGIHSRVSLLVYDMMPVDVGGLHTSALVPPLLAVFYVALGSLVLYADYRMAGKDKTTRSVMQHSSLAKMALSFGALAGMLELSSLLYSQDWSSSSICLVLAACAGINYLVFDGTKQGLALALLCAIAAPGFELVLMNSLGVWHYPQGDLYTSLAGGLPKFVPFCYFMYVPAVCNLSRYLWKTF